MLNINLTLNKIYEIYEKYSFDEALIEYNNSTDNQEYKYLFLEIAIENKNLKLCKLLFDFENIIFFKEFNKKYFTKACDNNCIDIVKWFLEIWDDIVLDIDTMEFNYKWTLINDFTDISELLLQVNPNININKYSDFIFEMACINNNVKLAKWIYDSNPNIIYIKDTGYHNINCNLLNKKKFIQSLSDTQDLSDSQDFSDSQDSLDSLDSSDSSDSSDINLIDYNFENPFTEALEKGNLQIIDWLIQIIPKLYISTIYTNYLLILYAQQNLIDMAKWLLNYNVNKIKFIKFNYILEIALVKGHSDFYYFIIESFPNINLNEQNNNILIQNIIKNNTTNTIELINILIHKNSSLINIIDFNKLLLITCTNSTLVVLEYLISLKTNIDLTFNNYQLFRAACYSKNLNIAKWLFNKYQNFDITYNNHELFSKCCFVKLSNYNNKDFFDWFCSINPNL